MGCSLSHTTANHKNRPGEVKPQHPPRVKNGSVVAANITDLSNEHFTQTQKLLLRETWDVLSVNQHQHGVEIFTMIFVNKPQTKQLFPFRDLEGEELLKNPLFCSHAKRFMHAIETTVHHLDALDLILVPVLHRLGQKHVKITGFKIDYLSVFIGSMLDVFAEELGRAFTQDVRAAWLHLGEFIASKMNEGFQMELSRVSIQKELSRFTTEGELPSVPEQNGSAGEQRVKNGITVTNASPATMEERP